MPIEIEVATEQTEENNRKYMAGLSFTCGYKVTRIIHLVRLLMAKVQIRIQLHQN